MCTTVVSGLCAGLHIAWYVCVPPNLGIWAVSRLHEFLDCVEHMHHAHCWTVYLGGFFSRNFELEPVGGVSLSELHTSMTSLHTCVCMFVCLLACLDRPLTENFKWVCLNVNIAKITLDGLSWRAIGRVQCRLRRLKLKHTWQLTACLLQSSTASSPQAV